MEVAESQITLKFIEHKYVNFVHLQVSDKLSEFGLRCCGFVLTKPSIFTLGPRKHIVSGIPVHRISYSTPYAYQVTEIVSRPLPGAFNLKRQNQ